MATISQQFAAVEKVSRNKPVVTCVYRAKGRFGKEPSLGWVGIPESHHQFGRNSWVKPNCVKPTALKLQWHLIQNQTVHCSFIGYRGIYGCTIYVHVNIHANIVFTSSLACLPSRSGNAASSPWALSVSGCAGCGPKSTDPKAPVSRHFGLKGENQKPELANSVGMVPSLWFPDATVQALIRAMQCITWKPAFWAILAECNYTADRTSTDIFWDSWGSEHFPHVPIFLSNHFQSMIHSRTTWVPWTKSNMQKNRTMISATTTAAAATTTTWLIYLTAWCPRPKYPIDRNHHLHFQV